MNRGIHKGAVKYTWDEPQVHLISYHLVWCPKRAKSVLTGEIAQDCADLIQSLCDERGWSITKLEIAPDFVYLNLRVFPSDAASDVLKDLKAYTAHTLRPKHPVLRKLPSMWTRAFFASTACSINSDLIRSYVSAQRGV